MNSEALPSDSQQVTPDATSNGSILNEAGRADCSVIIVTYNSQDDISRLLESIPAAGPGLKLRVIVVDNGSSDSTVDLVRCHREVICVQTGANLGYAGGINVGRKYAGDYSALLVLNPDTILEPGALKEMMGVLEDPMIGMVAPMLLDLDGTRFPSLRNFPTLARAIGDALLGSRIGQRPNWLREDIWSDRSYNSRHTADWATGAALLISRVCDQNVGLWDEQFFLYSEETDYAARARAAGFTFEYLPTARVFHRGGGSSQSSSLVALMAISRVRYIEKHGHWPRIYRLVLIFAELLRSSNTEHRAAMRALLHRSRWPELIEHLRNPAEQDADARQLLQPSRS